VYKEWRIVEFLEEDSSVDIATGVSLGGRGSIPDRRKGLFSSPQRPDRLWGPPSLLSSGYRGLKQPGPRMVELYLHSPYVSMAWWLIN
jgi:hypothetical protein